MFVLSVDLRIKPENVESFISKALENAAHSRKEPGCRQFDMLVYPKDRTLCLLFAEAMPLLASRERHVWKRAAP